MVFYKLKKKKLTEKLTPIVWFFAGLLWIVQNVFCKRSADEIVKIGYLQRWFIIPKNRFLNVYYHKFTGSDDETLHDHPWHSVSIILKGTYLEYSPGYLKPKRTGSISFRSGSASHRVEICGKEVHTIFITGPKYKDWGFFTKNGWVHHITHFLAEERNNKPE
jgi:hypothetical protein